MSDQLAAIQERQSLAPDTSLTQYALTLEAVAEAAHQLEDTMGKMLGGPDGKAHLGGEDVYVMEITKRLQDLHNALKPLRTGPVFSWPWEKTT